LRRRAVSAPSTGGCWALRTGKHVSQGTPTAVGRTEIQVRFVDEPRGAVEDADALVATVMQRLAEGFASERERLEAQRGRGISTEDLRVALQRYRSFFQRLLAT
jgi:sirohydrochlorin ferrochelatase